MSDSETPQWDFLPHRPREFFELEVGFGRQELKRAYNKWLRLFKPDKFPKEFQQIRAAYEYLESGLRYGRETEFHTPPSNAPKPRTDSPDSTAEQVETGDERHVEPPQESHIDKPHIQLPDNAVVRPSDESEDETIDANANPLLDAQTPEDEGETPRNFNGQVSWQSNTKVTDQLLQDLERYNAREVFLKIANGSTKTARDYFTLAVLSDAVAQEHTDITAVPQHCIHLEPRHGFFYWLVEGLKQYPTDSDLQVLLRQYATLTPFTDTELESLLLHTAESINTDSFYFLTEPMWTRYLSVAPWEQFAATLTSCETKIRDNLIFSRCAFYVYMLRKAAWKAPVMWLDQKLREIDENQGFIHFHLEQDLELTTQLIEFRKQEMQFASKGAVSKRIAQSLRDFCELDEEISFRTVVETQSYIAANPAQLFAEFQLTPNENVDALRPWLWVTHGALDRVDSQDVASLPINPNDATLSVLRELDRTFPKRLVDILQLQRYGTLLLCIMLYYAVAVPISMLVSALVNYEGTVVICILLFTAVLAYLLYRYSSRTELWLKRRFFRRVVERHYLRSWRFMLARLFAASHFDYQTIRDSITRVCTSHESQLHVSTWLPHLYPRDIGLVVYSMAVKFER